VSLSHRLHSGVIYRHTVLTVPAMLRDTFYQNSKTVLSAFLRCGVRCVVTPPISVRRIDRYDGHRVPYHDRSHKTERVERETVDVHTLIGRMVQHVVPKGFKRVRYYGVQATKSFARLKPVIQAAGPDHGIGHFGFLRSIPHAHRGGLSGAGGTSTASKIAANIDRGF
jgi:hypothetical protein